MDLLETKTTKGTEEDYLYGNVDNKRHPTPLSFLPSFLPPSLPPFPPPSRLLWGIF